MKRICGLLLSGFCLLFGVLQTNAQTNQVISSTTNYWVQNVNATITAYVASGGGIISGTLPSKQLLTFLSGVTNLFNQLQTITNVTVTNLTGSVTNSLNLPPTNYPSGYDLTNEYVVTSTSFFGVVSYTNNIQFTNDVEFTLLTNDPVTYNFTNVIEQTNGQVTYLFPNVPANSLTAVLSTNSNDSNVVFTLSGSVTKTNHTPVYEVFPDFSKQKGAKLIAVTPIQTETLLLTNGVTTNIVTALPWLYMVRYSTGKTVTNVDVTSCFGEVPEGTRISAQTSLLTVSSYNLTRWIMDTTQSLFGAFPSQPGIIIDMEGFDFKQNGIVLLKGKPVPVNNPDSLNKARKLSGGAVGQVNGQIATKTFNQAKAVYSGSISFSAGHLENSL